MPYSHIYSNNTPPFQQKSLWSNTPFRLWRLFLLLGCLVGPGVNDCLWAQTNPEDSIALPYHFETFEIQDLDGADPADIAVHSIAQDSFGFMWFGTRQHGLYRYDGKNFKRYNNVPDDPKSLSDDWVEDLYVDTKGRLWVGTLHEGLNLFDPIMQSFQRFQFDSSNIYSLSSNQVRSIIADKEGYLWIGTDKGLNRLDSVNGQFTRFKHNPKDSTSLSFNIIHALHIDQLGTLWIGTGRIWGNELDNNFAGGLNQYHPETGTFTRYANDPNDSQSLINNNVSALHEDSQGKFWVGTHSDGLHLMDRKTGAFTRYPYDPDNAQQLSRPYLSYAYDGRLGSVSHVSFIHEDHNRLLWIGAIVGGVNLYNPQTNKLISMKKAGWNLPGAYNLIETADGTIWLSHFSMPGLGKDSQPNKLLKITPHSPGLFGYYNLNKISDSIYIQTIAEDANGNLWLGAAEPPDKGLGLIRFNRQTGEFKQFLNSPGKRNSLKNNDVHAITIDREGILWIGTWHGEGGLDRFDPSNESFTNYSNDPSNPNSLSDDWVIDILETRDGALWISTAGGGLCYFDRDLKSFDCYQHDSTIVSSITLDMAEWLIEGPKGHIWVHSWGVNVLDFLDEFDPQTKQFIHHTSSFPKGIVFRSSIAFDQTGQIWAATNQGLLQYNPQTKEPNFHSFDFGLITSPQIRSLFFDPSGYLWVSQGKIISRINPSDGTSVRFNILPDVSRVDQTHWSSNGEFFFGGLGGLMSFDSKKAVEIQANSPPAQIKFTGFHSLDKGLKTPLPEWKTQSLQLEHSQSTFTIKFLATNYQTDDPLKMSYLLENYDREWQEVKQLSQADYFDVPRGEIYLSGKSYYQVGESNGKEA